MASKRAKLPEKSSESAECPEGSNQQHDQKTRFASMESVYEHLGGAGRYNIAVLIIMMFCKVFPGMITLSPNFTAVPLPFNCSDEPPIIPGQNCTMNSVRQQCYLVLNCSTGQWNFPCQNFTFYEGVFKSTVVSRFSLVCDSAWMSSLATTFYFVGFLIGCSFYGALADRFGRRKIIITSAINLSLFIVGASFAPFLWLYWTLQLLAGIGNGGLLTSLYTYALENTDTKHRAIWGFLVHNGWSLGLLGFTMLAYFIRSYQLMLLYGGLSVLLLLVVVPFLSESPRWLVSTGRFEAADKVLNRIGRINGRSLGPEFSSRLIATAENMPVSTEASQIWHMLSRPGIRKLTLVTWFIFFGVSMAYFGLSLSAESLGSNLFISQVLLAIVEPPSRLFCLLLSFRLGRKALTAGSFTLAGLSLIATGLLMQWPELNVWRLTAAVTGKFWITMAFDLAWLYAAEIFPTVLRSIGIGSSSTMARAGALLSTLIHLTTSVWTPLPFLAFAVGPLAGAGLTLLCLPETREQNLPESLADGEKCTRGGRLKTDFQSDGPEIQES